jgi:hypothetical protein
MAKSAAAGATMMRPTAVSLSFARHSLGAEIAIHHPPLAVRQLPADQHSISLPRLHSLAVVFRRTPLGLELLIEDAGSPNLKRLLGQSLLVGLLVSPLGAEREYKLT